MKASKSDRRYAPGVADIGVRMCPLEVKMEPTYEDDRQAVFTEFDDSYETRLGIQQFTCSAYTQGLLGGSAKAHVRGLWLQ